VARLRGLAEDIEAPPPGRFADHGEESRWLVAANQEFHGMIVTASRNGRLEKLIRRTAEVPLMFKALFWYGPRERAISNHYHRQILKAPETGDGERAEIIVREHVYEGRAFVIGALKEEVR
jgi:DNA-binding GntR family transcriptional regulator